MQFNYIKQIRDTKTVSHTMAKIVDLLTKEKITGKEISEVSHLQIELVSSVSMGCELFHKEEFKTEVYNLFMGEVMALVEIRRHWGK